MSVQTDRILEYLREHKDITPLRAWDVCGVYRLSDVIFKLRRKGYNITTEKAIVKNRFGEKCEVAKYILHEGTI